jgi:membrane associated rhomboid family serine protease
LPGSFSQFIRKPWTLITHMFYHQGLWHIIGQYALAMDVRLYFS